MNLKFRLVTFLPWIATGGLKKERAMKPYAGQ